MFLVWGINNWTSLPEEKRPPGTQMKKGVMHTFMAKEENTFIVTIQVPRGVRIDYGFLITKIANGKGANIWDGNQGEEYHVFAEQDGIVERRATLAEVQAPRLPGFLRTRWIVAGLTLIVSVVLFLKFVSPHKRRVILNELGKSTAAILLIFLILEGLLRIVYSVRNSMVEYVPLPYAFGQVYGPIPPWLDGLRILEEDNGLIWKGRPNVSQTYVDIFSPVQTQEERVSPLRQFFPSIPTALKKNLVWDVSLNSEGFRDREFHKEKPPSAFRILCLGDSWTFGANVGSEDTYPQQLTQRLRREFFGKDFEVLNFGVLGYSSYQGLELLREKVIDMNPDLVLLGFAMNDASVKNFMDKEWHPKDKAWAKALLEKIETYKLLRYLADLIKYKPPSVSEFFKQIAGTSINNLYLLPRIEGMEDHEQLKGLTRVSLADYEQNYREMIEVARNRGAEVILLYNELSPNSPYRSLLKHIAKTTGVPLLDSQALLVEAKEKIESELEESLSLQPTKITQEQNTDEVTIVFRVYMENASVSKAVYIVGSDQRLGGLVPNKVAMYDDGTHGDQIAGDHVWSLSARFPVGSMIAYVYTNSGREGQWEGLDVPQIRGFKVEDSPNRKVVYRPIESFGQLYMQADSWHTNGSGNELIAKALVDLLKQNAKVKHFVESKQGLSALRARAN